MAFAEELNGGPSASMDMFADSPQLDALLVLGRGIDEYGQLSETSRLRTRMAVDLALIAMPSVVVFSGGSSWKQRLEGEEPPISEGAGMLAEAREYIAELGEEKFAGITLFLDEKESGSTTENMEKSRGLLNLPKRGGVLGIMTDELHNREKRVDFLAKLVFPKTAIVVYDTVPNPDITEADVALEKKTALATRVAMFGVWRGHGKAIMRRQRMLERANALRERLSKAKDSLVQALAS